WGGSDVGVKTDPSGWREHFGITRKAVLGQLAVVLGVIIFAYGEHGGGGPAMKVGPGPIRLDHLRLVGDSGSGPQLDLGVVRDDEAVARSGHESLTQFAAPDVLEVRLLRGEAPGGGAGRLEAGVDASVVLDVSDE